MKKSSKMREPSRASLRDVPPVDFGDYKPGRRNPFAARMRRERLVLKHDGPSQASLRAIPELPPDSKGMANPYAGRLKADGYELQVGRGRPVAGTEVGPTTVKSVRLPPMIWARLEERANEAGIALHALIRATLVELLEDRPKRRRTG